MKIISTIFNFMIILFITSNLHPADFTKLNDTSLNIIMNPDNMISGMVIHKDGTKGYIAISNCCILFADLLNNTCDMDNQINFPFYNFGEMESMAINTLYDELYVIGSDPYLYIIDTQKNEIDPSPIKINNYPQNIIVSKDGQTIYLCSRQKVAIIDVKTREIIENIDIDATAPYGMAIANNKLFVVGRYNQKIYVIDLINKSLNSTISVSEYPYYAVTNANETYVYISHDGQEGKVTVINAVSNKIDKEIILKSYNSAYKNSKELTIVNNVLFVANWGDNTISKINTITNKEIICNTPIESGFSHPEKLVSSIDKKKLYIISKFETEIKIYNINNSCPSIKNELDHCVYNDEREKAIPILETEICENQPLTFTVITDNPELFYIPPEVSSEGILHYQPYTKNSGITTIHISISDDTGQCSVSQSFNITVIATGPVLSLLKKGRGQIQIDDGDKVFKTVTPFNEYYPKNSLIKLTAIPDKNYIFSGWTKDLTDNSNPIDIILSKDTTIRANFVETKGYAIIVQGKRSDNEGLEAHGKTTDLAYKTFISKGIETDYFKYDDNNLMPPTLVLIENSIINTAYEKLKNKIGNFTILIVGHGSKEVIYIDNEKITSDLLKKWLDQLQLKLDADANIYNINIILGTCFSGSFIDDITGRNRIIITSSDIEEMAFKGPVIDNGIRQGDFFIAEFLKNIDKNYSIQKSFNNAVLKTKCFTRATSDNFVSIYDDRALQHPLLEDNNDGYASTDTNFSLTGDGLNSRSFFIGNNTTKSESSYLDYQFSSERLYLDENTFMSSFKIEYPSFSQFDLFWIDIKSPNTSNNFKPDSTDQLEIQTNYSKKGEISNDRAYVEWNDISAFLESGEYQLLFFASDYETREIMFLKEIIVHKQSKSNNPPEAFDVIKPKNEDIYPIYYEGEDKYFYILKWENSIDPDGDRLSYDVYISNSADFSNPLIIKYLLKNQAIVIFSDNFSDNLHFDEQYFWKVKAYDKYGSYIETDISTFQARNTSGGIGWLIPKIFDAKTQKKIQMASILKKDDNKTEYSIEYIKGEYYIRGSKGDFDIIIEAAGYEKNEIKISIPEGYMRDELIVLSRLFTIKDTISALKLLTKINSSFSNKNDINKNDINKDNKISLYDVIGTLNQISNY